MSKITSKSSHSCANKGCVVFDPENNPKKKYSVWICIDLCINQIYKKNQSNLQKWWSRVVPSFWGQAIFPCKQNKSMSMTKNHWWQCREIKNIFYSSKLIEKED